MMIHTVAKMVGRTRKFDGVVHTYAHTVDREGSSFHIWHSAITGSVWQTPAK
jgi:hypothetical protein